MHNKHLIRLFFVLTFLFLSSSAYLLLPDKPRAETSKPVIQDLPWTNVATGTALSDDKNSPEKVTKPKLPIVEIQKNEDLKTTTTIPAEENIKNPIITTVEIDGQQYKLDLPEKSTAYDAIKKLISDKKITATMKEFTGMGYFVEEINGIKNNNQTGIYWIYYINGQSAKVGISSYILKNNDLITWKFEKGI